MVKNKFIKVCGCKEDDIPIRYLGIPLYVGRLKAQYWDNLVQKIQNKLIGWKKKVLSYARKLILIKIVLQSILVY